MSKEASKSQAKVEPVTKAQLEEFVKLDAERKELQQKARVIEKRTKALSDHFKTYLESNERSRVQRGGYEAHLEEGRPIVSYQQICVERLGPLVVDEIVKEAPKSVKVVVQKVR